MISTGAGRTDSVGPVREPSTSSLGDIVIRYVVSGLVLAAALGSGTPATALVDCETGDTQCYRNCYLPHKDGGRIYWYNC